MRSRTLPAYRDAQWAEWHVAWHGMHVGHVGLKILGTQALKARHD